MRLAAANQRDRRPGERGDGVAESLVGVHSEIVDILLHELVKCLLRDRTDGRFRRSHCLRFLGGSFRFGNDEREREENWV